MIFTARTTGNVFEGAGGGFGDGFRKPGGAAFRDDDGAGSRGMGGADDRAEIVRIFDAVQDDEEFGRGGDIFEFGVLLFSSERDDSLMRFDAGEAIERATILKADRRAAFAREIDDLLQAMAARSASDEDAIEGALCPQRFDNRVDSNQNSQLSIIP